MLEEIVIHALGLEPNIELAGTVRTVEGLPRRIARAKPDVVVLGRNDVDLAAALLEQRPRLTVFAVAQEGEVTWLYALKLERTRLGALSPTTLVEAIRAATDPTAVGARWSS
jgi:DNA-binding NarL/FixJ family response regulator